MIGEFTLTSPNQSLKSGASGNSRASTEQKKKLMIEKRRRQSNGNLGSLIETAIVNENDEEVVLATMIIDETGSVLDPEIEKVAEKEDDLDREMGDDRETEIDLRETGNVVDRENADDQEIGEDKRRPICNTASFVYSLLSEIYLIMKSLKSLSFQI